MASGNSGAGQRRKGRSSSPASLSKAKTDGEGRNTSKEAGNKEESSSDKMSEFPCRFRTCKNPSYKFWHPPMCQNYKSEQGCIYGDTCHFRHVEAEGKPNKRSKKGGAKGAVATWKESIQVGCVSQDSYPRTSIIPREPGKLGTKHAVKFCKGTWHQKFNSGKKGSIARNYPKVCASMSVVLARQNSGKDHMWKPCTKKDAPAKQHGIWRKYSQAQEFGQSYVLYSY